MLELCAITLLTLAMLNIANAVVILRRHITSKPTQQQELRTLSADATTPEDLWEEFHEECVKRRDYFDSNMTERIWSEKEGCQIQMLDAYFHELQQLDDLQRQQYAE